MKTSEKEDEMRVKEKTLEGSKERTKFWEVAMIFYILTKFDIRNTVDLSYIKTDF